MSGVWLSLFFFFADEKRLRVGYLALYYRDVTLVAVFHFSMPAEEYATVKRLNVKIIILIMIIIIMHGFMMLYNAL